MKPIQHEKHRQDRIFSKFFKMLKSSQNVSQNVSGYKNILDDTVGFSQIFSKFSRCLKRQLAYVCLRSKTDHCGGFPEKELRGGENRSFILNVIVTCCMMHSLSSPCQVSIAHVIYMCITCPSVSISSPYCQWLVPVWDRSFLWQWLAHNLQNVNVFMGNLL